MLKYGVENKCKWIIPVESMDCTLRMHITVTNTTIEKIARYF